MKKTWKRVDNSDKKKVIARKGRMLSSLLFSSRQNKKAVIFQYEPTYNIWDNIYDGYIKRMCMSASSTEDHIAER